MADCTNPPVAIGEYEYNGLHLADGQARGRRLHYSRDRPAADHAFDGTHSDTRQAQQVWGVRYIDDAVLRRVREWVETDPVNDPGVFDWTDWEHFWYVTDVQFSVMALLDEAANVVERVSYDAYGNARHRRPADLDGDGDVDNSDLALHPQSSGLDVFIGDANYSADFDIDRDGSEDDIFDLLDYLNWQGPGMNTTALPDGQISETDAAAIPNVAVAPDNPIGYCGYVFNPEVRLYHVRHRWYSPELGRWLERDPRGYVDSRSLYEYANSTPVRRNDPSGLFCEDKCSEEGSVSEVEATHVGFGRVGMPTPFPSGYRSTLDDFAKRIGRGVKRSLYDSIRDLEQTIKQLDDAKRVKVFKDLLEALHDAADVLGDENAMSRLSTLSGFVGGYFFDKALDVIYTDPILVIIEANLHNAMRDMLQSGAIINGVMECARSAESAFPCGD